jgi:CubicO group peptidase (beta-lactamase class C family)
MNWEAQNGIFWDSALSDVVQRAIVGAGVSTHAVCGYVSRTADGWSFVGGSAQATQPAQAFDLASLTKPFLAIAAAELVRRSVWTFSTPLGSLLPAAQDTPGQYKTVAELLSHRAGLKAHVQLFRRHLAHHPINRQKLVRTAASAVRGGDLNEAVYSDLGYFLIGEAMQHREQRALDWILRDLVFEPWDLRVGSARAWMKSRPSFRKEVAPTEIRHARGGTLRGFVHDDNAWTMGGGSTCGHAGLFGTLEGILRTGAQILERTSQQESYLSPLVARRTGGSLRMGFDGISGPRSLAGARAGSDTFGHLGFTGTSLWMDPDRMRATVLLTNRVHPSHQNAKLQAVRPQIHDFLWDY